MPGRKLAQLALALALALTLSGCLISVQDGDGNVYPILADGTVDMSGANANNLNSIELKHFFPWNPDATKDGSLWCRSGEEFTQILAFEKAFNYWLFTFDIGSHPDTFVPTLASSCDGTYDSVEGTFTFDLAVAVGAAFLPVITADNTSCILGYSSGAEELVVGVDACLQADAREPAYNWGLNGSPELVNILKVVVDESVLGPS